jgi:hypothetical protein
LWAVPAFSFSAKSKEKCVPIEVSRQAVRRLAVTKQGLAGPPLAATEAGLLALVRQLGCVQLDPMRVVERSHRLVLWSRLGPYDPALLDRLRWQHKALFEYWAHAASLVLADNLAIHRHQMAAFAKRDSVPSRRQQAWMADNAGLRRAILRQLRAGPLSAAEIGAEPARAWQSAGWTNGRGVREMLELMWRQGQVVVAGREGRGKQYALPLDWFGAAWNQAVIPQAESRRRIAEISVRALGAGTVRHIEHHFVRGLDPDLPATLRKLVDAGRIIEVRLTDGPNQREAWYAHAEDEAELRWLAGPGDLGGRTALLSPFDNLICDRQRVRQLWDFEYSSEIYLPKDKRQFGHYVMPIVHGEELVGRIDPQLNRAKGSLAVHAAFAEAGWHKDRAVGRGLGQALASLAAFLGAERFELGRRMPVVWRREIAKEIG